MKVLKYYFPEVGNFELEEVKKLKKKCKFIRSKRRKCRLYNRKSKSCNNR